LFLTTRIPEEAFPRSQVPLIEGDPRSILLHVDSAKAQQIKAEDTMYLKTKINELASEKGLNVVNQDTLIVNFEKMFNMAIDSGWLMQPAAACANDLYIKLEGLRFKNVNLGKYRNKLLYALHNEVQQAINSILESDPVALYQWSTKPEKFYLYPAYLNRCMELIGIKHKMYSSLQSKKIYFDAYLKTQFSLDIETDPLKKKQIQNEILGLLMEAYVLDSTAAYIAQAIADLYLVNQPAQTDSMLHWTLLSISNSPTWLVPYINLALEYQVSTNQFDSSEYWLKRALAVDSTSIITMERLAWLKQRQNQTDQTISICEKIIKRYPNLPNGYLTLSHTYAFRRDFQNMKLNFEKSDEFKYDFVSFEPYMFRNRMSCYFIPYFNEKIKREDIKSGAKFSYAINLALSYYEIGNSEQAMIYVKIAEALNSQPWYLVEAKLIEAKIYYQQKELLKAEESFKHLKMIDPANPNYPKANAWLAKLAAENGELVKADSLFKVAISTWIGSAWDDFLPQEESHFLYGMFLIDQKRFQEAERMFLKSNEFSFQNGYMGWYGLACLEAKLKNEKAALQYLEKSLDCYYPRLDPLLKEPLFKKLRKTKRFKDIISKHFPDKQTN
ncbi:MAG: tetratricopeptide repeat protein, partial [Saprospiraceae bacterium]